MLLALLFTFFLHISAGVLNGKRGEFTPLTHSIGYLTPGCVCVWGGVSFPPTIPHNSNSIAPKPTRVHCCYPPLGICVSPPSLEVMTPPEATVLQVTGTGSTSRTFFHVRFSHYCRRPGTLNTSSPHSLAIPRPTIVRLFRNYDLIRLFVLFFWSTFPRPRAPFICFFFGQTPFLCLSWLS